MTDFDDEDGGQVRAAPVQRLVTLSGALVSLALICGLGYWGYKLLVRDVHGVPVVQAMEGAFRVAPQDPGGTEAPYQGLAVNEVAAEGTAGGQVDAVTLAPPPVDLAEEDVPRKVLEERRRADETAEAMAAAEPSAEVGKGGEDIAAVAPGDAGTGDGETALAALDDAAQDTTDEATEVVSVDDQPDGALATDLAVAEALAGIMAEEGEAAISDATSPRPSPRPAALRTAAAALTADRPVTVSAEMPRLAEVDVDALESGTRLVQLGAFADADVARREWLRISERFGDQFVDKRRIVQQATSGGKTFYRLRAEGFEDLADARRFCSTLMAAQTDCIPVELR